MSKLKIIFATILSVMHVVLVAAINISPSLAKMVSEQVSIYGIFAFLGVTFVAICYLGWLAYCNFAQSLDPAGACITGFALPVLTSFIATLCWSALAVIGALQAEEGVRYLGRFDQVSLILIFAIFMIGGIVWGALMKTPEYDDKTQEQVAVGYTVISYWFGFVVFSWSWLLLDRVL